MESYTLRWGFFTVWRRHAGPDAFGEHILDTCEAEVSRGKSRPSGVPKGCIGSYPDTERVT